jgi:hypothetical protein
MKLHDPSEQGRWTGNALFEVHYRLPRLRCDGPHHVDLMVSIADEWNREQYHSSTRRGGAHHLCGGAGFDLGGAIRQCWIAHRSRRDVEQCILLAGIERHVVFACPCGVDELDHDVVADVVDVPVLPLLKGNGGYRAAALFGRPLVRAAGWMGVDFIRRPVDDVDAATVGLPAGDARSEVLAGVSNAAVVLFPELVFECARRGVAAQPAPVPHRSGGF